MRSLMILCLLGGLSIAPLARGQADATSRAAEQNGPNKPEKDLSGWNLANFLVLAGLLGYLGVKYGAPYFRKQTETIGQELDMARLRKQAADLRAAEVDRKLAHLDEDIEQLKASILREQSAQVDRMAQQSEHERERVKLNAAQQIDSAGKRARSELQRFASRLALDLAEQRAQTRMNVGLQQVLTNQFVESLRS